MNSKEFRAELEKIMPGYSWTVQRSATSRLPKSMSEGSPKMLSATGIRSSGFNRLSTLQVVRTDHDGRATYLAKSAGFGTKARWLHEHSGATLAQALRGLQEHYKRMANMYRSQEAELKAGRVPVAQPGQGATTQEQGR